MAKSNVWHFYQFPFVLIKDNWRGYSTIVGGSSIELVVRMLRLNVHKDSAGA